MPLLETVTRDGILKERALQLRFTRVEVADIKRLERMMAKARALLRKAEGIDALADCQEHGDLDMTFGMIEHGCIQIAEDKAYELAWSATCFGVKV